MSDYSAFERLLGLPPGSTAQGEDELKPLLTTGIKNKTTDLVKKLDQIEVLTDMPQAELVKRGFSTFKIRYTSKAILQRHKHPESLISTLHDSILC